MTGFPADYRRRLVSALDTLPLDKVEAAIALLRAARDEDRQIFVCGNGGSAATASHFVCDMAKGCSYGHPRRFRILSLNDNLHTITAYANDVAYEAIFVEQLKNFARPGDLLLCLSGSGNSPNVLRAAEYANQAGLTTIAFTGRDGGQLAPRAQLDIRVADPHMGRIEDGHMAACHMIAYYFMEAER